VFRGGTRQHSLEFTGLGVRVGHDPAGGLPNAGDGWAGTAEWFKALLRDRIVA
jgi:hypothetical protein